MRSVLFILLIFNLFFFFSPLPVEAIQVVQVDYAKVRLIIPPGGTKTGTINISNPTPAAKHVKIYLEDWEYLPTGDGTKNFKPAGTTELSAANWISFSPSEVAIPAYGKKVLNYTVKVPEAARGGHYAVLFFESYTGDQVPTEGGVTVNLAIRVASLFYIEPEGTINRQAKIDNLQVNKETGKYYITADFSNTGNVDLATEGTFFIIDAGGIVYARGDFDDLYTPGGGRAKLVGSWKEPLPKGKYSLVLTVDIGRALEEAGLGRGPVITKETDLEIGDDGTPVKIGGLR